MVESTLQIVRMTGSKFGHIRLVIIAVSVVLVWLTSTPALAQTEPAGFKDVSLWLYPEYDDPRLLVMTEGQIEGSLPPTTVTFLVPSGAEMYSAGSIDARGGYTGGPPRRTESAISGWDEISYEVTTGIYRVEYYHDSIEGYPDKTIYQEYTTLVPIDDLLIFVQQPLEATDFHVTPSVQPLEEWTDNDLGFHRHIYHYEGIEGNQSIAFNLSYTKENPDPSIVIGAGSNGVTDRWLVSWPVIVTAVAAVVLVLGVGFYWLTRKPYRGEKGVIPHHQPTKKPANIHYCTECGHKLKDSPRFCPSCGTRLHK